MAQSVVLVVALLIGVLYYCSAENVYCVTPTPTSCSSCPHNSIHCATLSEYAQEVETYFSSNTTMVFLSGVHALATNITVTANIARLTMEGKSSSGNLPTVVCSGSVGFSFTSIVDFKIHSLAFTSCSRTYTISLDDASSFLDLQYNTRIHNRSPPSIHLKYALHLQFIQYAELVNCSFHDNLGTALVVSSTNVILAGNSNFTHNHCTESNSCVGGGGIAAFSSMLTFTGNTTFFENNANVYGAGIFMIRCRLSSTGSIHFINNLNLGLQLFVPAGTVWAAASSLQFNGTNNFINNSARSDFGGVGGAIYALYTSLSFTGVSNFEQNSATSAGAIYAAGNSVLHFSGTSNFSSNNATLGGAIFSTLNTTLIFDGTASFTDNGHDIGEIIASQGGGIVLALTSTISILPNTTVYWVNNRATSGGAISVWEMTLNGSFDTTFCTQFDTCRPRINCFFQLPGQNMSNGIDAQLVSRTILLTMQEVCYMVV